MKLNWTVVALALVALAILWTHYDQPGPGTVAPGREDGTRVGRQYGAALPRTVGAAWLAARAKLRADPKSTLKDCVTVFQTTWAANLNTLFTADVQPALDRIVSDKDAVAVLTADQRANLDRFWLDLGTALGGRAEGTAEPDGVQAFLTRPGPGLLFLFMIVTGFAICGTVAILHLIQLQRANQVKSSLSSPTGIK